MDQDQRRPGGTEGEAAIAAQRRIAWLAAALLLAAAPVRAGPADARRLAAEVRVMAGDVARVAAADLPGPQRQGLRARLAGAAASLPLLVREAGGNAKSIKAARRVQAAVGSGDWPAAAAALDELVRRHPLGVAQLLAAAPDAGQVKVAADIHRQACAGCHEHPDPQAPLPAMDLFATARSQPAEEFLARLINGVRGTAALGYRNPFSDAELAALWAYYRGVPAPR